MGGLGVGDVDWVGVSVGDVDWLGEGVGNVDWVGVGDVDYGGWAVVGDLRALDLVNVRFRMRCVRPLATLSPV